MSETTTDLADPGTRVKSERAAIRRDILRELRFLASAMHSLIGGWAETARWYDGRKYRAVGKHATILRAQSWRWRRWGEYRENDPTRMRADAEWLRGIAGRAYALAERLDVNAHVADKLIIAREREERRARQH